RSTELGGALRVLEPQPGVHDGTPQHRRELLGIGGCSGKCVAPDLSRVCWLQARSTRHHASKSNRTHSATVTWTARRLAPRTAGVRADGPALQASCCMVRAMAIRSPIAARLWAMAPTKP